MTSIHNIQIFSFKNILILKESELLEKLATLRIRAGNRQDGVAEIYVPEYIVVLRGREKEREGDRGGKK